jgi:hypothetical protein
VDTTFLLKSTICGASNENWRKLVLFVLDERGKHELQMTRTVALDVCARLERSHGKSAKIVP